jgi:hypothetical protein
MPIRFPGWSTLIARWVVYGGPVLLVLLLAAPMVYLRTPYYLETQDPVDQPVQFDHRHHVHDDRIDCRFCHRTVEEAASAGYPATEVCMACHSQVWNTAPILEQVRSSYFTDQPIRWHRVHRLPQFVYFNHSIHVNKGVGCIECHGRVDQMPLVEQTAPLTMGWCLDCHRHPLGRLRPKSEVTSMTWKPQGDAAAEQKALASLYQVKTRTNCTTCHR